MHLDELSLIVHRSRRISKQDSSSRCIMHLVPIFLLDITYYIDELQMFAQDHPDRCLFSIKMVRTNYHSGQNKIMQNKRNQLLLTLTSQTQDSGILLQLY